MDEIMDKFYNYWSEALASLAVGLLVLKARMVQEEKKTIESRIDGLEKQHIALSSDVKNVKENQTLIREDIQVIKEFILKNFGE